MRRRSPPPAVPRRRGTEPWGEHVPIRSELFSPERFAEHAASLADEHVVVRRPRPVVPLLQRLGEDAAAIRAAHRALSAEIEQGRALTPAAEWLVDNMHVVVRQVGQIRQDLPPSYFRELPKLGAGFLAGHPRIFALMWAYIAHSDSLVDPEQVAEFVRAYERRKALTIGELWAVAITLRFLLVENLRRLAGVLVASAQERARADEVADRLLGLDAIAPRGDEVDLGHVSVTSRAFAVQLIRRMTGSGPADPNTWLREQIEGAGLDPDSIAHEEHQAQATSSVTMRNIFTSLRLIGDVDWGTWFESVSLIEQELRGSPGYSDLDFATRNLYREAVEDLARGSGQREIDVTRAALARARQSGGGVRLDVGFWLFDDGRQMLAKATGYRPTPSARLAGALRRMGVGGYLASQLLVTTVLSVAVAALVWGVAEVAGPPTWVEGLSPLTSSAPPTWVLLVALAAWLPMSELGLAIVNRRAAKIFPARPLPGLSLGGGVPEHLRTLIAVPTLLDSPAGVDELVDRLEEHHLSNRHGEVYAALVTDWTDHDEENRHDDEMLLARAVAGVARLNDTYPGDRFLLLHRGRRWNPAEGVWIGWERKRGKLEQLNAVLTGRGDAGDLRVVAGRLPGPFRYVLTVDSDTRLLQDTARRLVGKIAHPLNRPRYDARGRQVRGYGILQPRVTPTLSARDRGSVFQRLYSTQQGRDPYAFAVSDVYQDAFASGSFSGKGIYDIESVTLALAGRIPENTLLSHDLLEGNYARSGLVTDVEVVEDHPTSYPVSAQRDHRWVRGDWQLLPWLLGRSGLSLLGRWKILDNLRRSLVPLILVVGIVGGYALLPTAAAVAWALLLLSTVYVPSLLGTAGRLVHPDPKVTWPSWVGEVLTDVRDSLLLGTMNVVLLPHRAWTTLDAVTRTLVRLTVTRRHLLEWTSAAHAERLSRDSVRYYTVTMAGGSVTPLALLAVAALHSWYHLAAAAPFAAVWLVAPVVAQRASRIRSAAHALTEDQREELRRIGRRTWHYFDTVVTEVEHHLPPDNVQETPEPVVAARTSPTNIGLYLLSVVAASDLGWIGRAEALRRLDLTLGTIGSLPTYRGHLYNWYGTRTLTVLTPAYVSTVDSGNLAGHLVTLAQACREWADPSRDPREQLSAVAQAGLRDTMAVCADVVTEVAPELPEDVRDRVLALVPSLRHLSDLHPGAREVEGVDELFEELERLLVSDRTAGPGSPAQRLLAWACGARRTLRSHEETRHLDDTEVAALAGRAAELADLADSLGSRMQFGFLQDRRRRLLSIGFHVPERRLDESCYDLLASEARLASFLAVAKGDVRPRHWSLLGRPLTEADRGAALQSWSGSMFEYLMPELVMWTPPSSLIGTTNYRVVRRQRSYAAHRSVPWGVSESAYNARDVHLTYQYSPFGVPGLGLVRGLADNLVVAPYATALAAMVDPEAALANFRHLTRLGARGDHGFYDAVDFTPRRLLEGQPHAVVQCFMAHHQGMTVLGLHAVLLDGLMRDRFHRNPQVRATELLLQERAPRGEPVSRPRSERRPLLQAGQPTVTEDRLLSGSSALAPALHCLSSGGLALTLTPAGGGQLRWQGLALTRWRPDRTTEQLGPFVYLREGEDLWSAAPAPLPGWEAEDEVRFTESSASWTRHRRGLSGELSWAIGSEAAVAVQRLRLGNRTRADRTVDCTSYAELVLGAARDDAAHPAFSKMFVHTEYDESLGAILATRKQRSESDPEVWFGQMLVVETVPPVGTTETPGLLRPTYAETDRRSFLGRGGDVSRPAALTGDLAGTGTTGWTLDPVSALGASVTVPADGEVVLSWWSAAGSSREEVWGLLDQHRSVTAHARVLAMSWTQAQVELRHLGLTPGEASELQALAGHATYPHPVLRPRESMLLATGSPQSALWVMGISGDLPIVLVSIDDAADIGLVRQLVRGFGYWQLVGFAADLVVLNERPTSYAEELQRELEQLAGSSTPLGAGGAATGQVHVLRSDQLADQDRRALQGTATVHLVAARGDLAAQLPRVVAPNARELAAPAPTQATPSVTRQPPSPEEHLLFPNGFGGFSSDGSEYVVTLEETATTPAPWTNVVANEVFGFHATAQGAGYTWWRNSRDNQLTPWRNDPVSEPLSEGFYVRDEDTGLVVTPTASPVPVGRHEARHGFGYTTYSHARKGLRLELTQTLAGDDPVKLSFLSVTNTGRRRRRLRVSSYAEPVLGFDRGDTGRHLRSEVEEGGAVVVTNPWSIGFADQAVGFDLVAPVSAQGSGEDSVTCDRREFLGLQGNLRAPRAVISGKPLSGRVGAGFDQCVAVQRVVTVEPGQTVRLTGILAAATDRDELLVLMRRCRGLDPLAHLAAERQRWHDRLSLVRVETPDPAFDVMMNGWLLYQTLACRMLARSGYYQASGAFGFRDQLQDSMSVVLVDPALAREHLLRAAGRQFVEGDVQHWWLPATGQGVRTRISDDVVWLAHATARYVEVTGDAGVLDEQIGLLRGEVLEAGEHERFFHPEDAGRTISLYEHCLLALERATDRGPHGLPLFGTGDWNDGMNRVGAAGRGESVWLGWFLHATLQDFLPLAEARGHDDVVRRWREEQKRLVESLDDAGWDGGWYRRGYFDDGTPLGSSQREECRIDAIAQSWATLSGAGDPERARTAMEAVDRELVLHEEEIARLFTPPFEASSPDPGYVGAYPPGVRENGGQYTHAAVWSVFAWAVLGRAGRAGDLFAMINPVNHSVTPLQAERYRVEPYVLAADVYSEEPYVGRGGWTWYTGSSGWLFRAGLEAVLGLHLTGDHVRLAPCLPPSWDRVSVRLRHGTSDHLFEMVHADEPGGLVTEVDGAAVFPADRVPLFDDGATHHVRVRVPKPPREESPTGSEQ
jgi:cyclic beta-1,2-glucan synthetase